MNKQIIAPYKKWMVGPKSGIPDQNYLIIGSNGQQPPVFHEHPMQSSEVKLTLLPTPNPTRNFSKSIETFNFERFIFDGLPYNLPPKGTKAIIFLEHQKASQMGFKSMAFLVIQIAQKAPRRSLHFTNLRLGPLQFFWSFF